LWLSYSFSKNTASKYIMDAGTGEMYAMIRKHLTLSLRLYTDSAFIVL
jgi:hypothetical protein